MTTMTTMKPNDMNEINETNHINDPLPQQRRQCLTHRTRNWDAMLYFLRNALNAANLLHLAVDMKELQWPGEENGEAVPAVVEIGGAGRGAPALWSRRRKRSAGRSSALSSTLPLVLIPSAGITGGGTSREPGRRCRSIVPTPWSIPEPSR